MIKWQTDSDLYGKQRGSKFWDHTEKKSRIQNITEIN